MKTKTSKYGRCECCGGRVIERRLTVDRRFHGRLFEFEGVPVGVCEDCGQRIYKGPVLQRLGRMAESRTKFKRSIRVPVARYKSAAE